MSYVRHYAPRDLTEADKGFDFKRGKGSLLFLCNLLAPNPTAVVCHAGNYTG